MERERARQRVSHQLGWEGGREGEGDAQICWLGLPKVDSDDDDDCRNVLGLDSGAGAQDIPETTQ